LNTHPYTCAGFGRYRSSLQPDIRAGTTPTLLLHSVDSPSQRGKGFLEGVRMWASLGVRRICSSVPGGTLDSYFKLMSRYVSD
jgi:hypothetical protein